MEKITQAEGDFLKACLGETLRQLEYARKQYKIVAKNAKAAEEKETSLALYKELAKINEYLKKTAEIQRKIKRGAFVESRNDVTVYHDYHISTPEETGIDLRDLMDRHMGSGW